MLTAYVRSCVSNWADAQDIVQDTLRDAFLGLSRFDRARPFEPWLRAICRNRVKKRFRSLARDRERLVPLDDVALRYGHQVTSGVLIADHECRLIHPNHVSVAV